jgi:membrane protease YdiL (CAAX protease family)
MIAQKETSVPVFSVKERITAVFDVLAVFLATFTLIWLMRALLPIRKMEQQFLAYIIMITFTLLILLVTRSDLKAYGLNFSRLRDQLNLTLAVFPVILIEGMIIGLLGSRIPNPTIAREGALILIITDIFIFAGVAWILRRKPTLSLMLPAFFLVFPLVQGQAILPERLTGFVFYLLFLGPGEELLFRGYIQSRLNAAFGRPFRFWGVPFGWGLLITALIFGFMHVLNPFNPFLGRYNLYIWWGVWTVFAGLTIGYIREKAGSVLPPALLHGLPQAIATIFGFIPFG